MEFKLEISIEFVLVKNHTKLCSEGGTTAHTTGTLEVGGSKKKSRLEYKKYILLLLNFLY